MAARTGVPLLHKLAIKMCRALAKYSGIIAKLYPENPSLQLAIITASASCTVLQNELALVREWGD